MELSMIARKYIFVLFFALSIFGSMFIFISYHENAHKEVFRSYGIDSNIDYFNTGGNHSFWDFTATTTSTGNKACSAQCISDQNHVDIEGYHMIALIISLWMMTTLILIKDRLLG